LLVLIVLSSSYNLQGSSFDMTTYSDATGTLLLVLTRWDIQTGNNYTTQPMPFQNPSSNIYVDPTSKLVFIAGTDNATNRNPNLYVWNYTDTTVAPVFVKNCSLGFAVNVLLLDESMGNLYLLDSNGIVYLYDPKTCVLGKNLTNNITQPISNRMLSSSIKVTPSGYAVFVDVNFCFRRLNLRTDQIDPCLNMTQYVDFSVFGSGTIAVNSITGDVYFQDWGINNNLAPVLLYQNNGTASFIQIGQQASGSGFEALSIGGVNYLTVVLSDYFTSQSYRIFYLAPNASNTTYLSSSAQSPYFQNDINGTGVFGGSGSTYNIDPYYPPFVASTSSGTSSTSTTSSSTTSSSSISTIKPSSSSFTSSSSKSSSTSTIKPSSSSSTSSSSSKSSSSTTATSSIPVSCNGYIQCPCAGVNKDTCFGGNLACTNGICLVSFATKNIASLMALFVILILLR